MSSHLALKDTEFSTCEVVTSKY